ncbi:MAG: NlpC/P60 family protein [Nitratireductor sp.]
MTPSQLPDLHPLDRRLNAWRDDLADARLEGRVVSARFVESEPFWVNVPVADLRREPRHDCGIDHQLLEGEEVEMFEQSGDWAWIRSSIDGYVGWVAASSLKRGTFTATHGITAPRTFVYPGADLKFPHQRALSMGSLVNVVAEEQTRGTNYLQLADGGFIIARHAAPAGQMADDYVAVAQSLIRTPYLWGGTSGFGIDCSGLVQLAMRMCGRTVLRDSDMQAASIGKEIDPGSNWSNLQRGDLVFWKGHVAIVEGEGMLLHANGNTMDVTSEPLVAAIERIERLYALPIGCRRP